MPTASWCHRRKASASRTPDCDTTGRSVSHFAAVALHRRVQIVDYEAGAVGDDEDAALWLADDGQARRCSLAPGAELAYGLGERHCAGVRDGGTHERCPNEGVPYCDRHTGRWACARCTGECDRPLSTCREEHAVYLAAFAPAMFKVGVTRSWRLETRLREQGADRGAHLRTVADGRTARRIEADIATDVGDRVRVRAKRRGLAQSVDESAWAELLARFDPIDTFAFAYGLDLAERPVGERLASGRVRGTKGRVLVLERAGSNYAVDMRDLVGYELTDRDDRPLQSSFAAFE
jgi:hypothetical protein